MSMRNEDESRTPGDEFRPIANPLPLVQWLLSMGVVTVLGWMIFSAINGLQL